MVSPIRMIRPQSGFSLVEVAMAVGVVAFALLAIVGLLAVGMNASRESREETRSVLLSQDMLAKVRESLAPNGIASVGSFQAGTFTNYYDHEGHATNASGYFRAVATIAAIDSQIVADPASTQLLGVHLTITWPQPANTATNQQVIFLAKSTDSGWQ